MYLATITKYMSVSLFVLAVLNAFGLLNLPVAYLLGFSFSALFFTIIDVLDQKGKDKRDPFAFRKTKEVIYFLAVTTFMVVPFIKVNWDNTVLTKLNDTTVLLSVGIIFLINSLKYNKMVSEELDRVIQDHIQGMVDSEAHRKMVQEITDEAIREVNVEEVTREAIDKIYKEEQRRLGSE
ncbi:hypothetical protein KP806_07645 [Paenibacillus sp. N4]|uniref:hypothetical protein n=1 Tax=Paenibacillus vietnamensis TaxID=2590547 RepID=UPI001CD0CFAD|nr:hypothetical protein [Paenibacillus vietnamensis]MCA0754920.1 hypothetical protein [Paenibacillus vietnamensis]